MYIYTLYKCTWRDVIGVNDHYWIMLQFTYVEKELLDVKLVREAVVGTSDDFLVEASVKFGGGVQEKRK